MPFYAVAKLQQTRISSKYQSDLLDITDDSLLNSEFQGRTLRASIAGIATDLPQTRSVEREHTGSNFWGFTTAFYLVLGKP
jgi:hypothetical protein